MKKSLGKETKKWRGKKNKKSLPHINTYKPFRNIEEYGNAHNTILS
jgi:hypothetical protein